MKNFTLPFCLLLSAFSVNAQGFSKSKADELLNQLKQQVKEGKYQFNKPQTFSYKGDVVMINMPWPKFLFQNGKGDVYQHSLDQMRFLDPWFFSRMPVTGNDRPEHLTKGPENGSNKNNFSLQKMMNRTEQ
jgi:hypothetical protein